MPEAWENRVPPCQLIPATLDLQVRYPNGDRLTRYSLVYRFACPSCDSEMADILISYARVDEARVARAEACVMARNGEANLW